MSQRVASPSCTRNTGTSFPSAPGPLSGVPRRRLSLSFIFAARQAGIPVSSPLQYSRSAIQRFCERTSIFRSAGLEAAFTDA